MSRDSSIPEGENDIKLHRPENSRKISHFPLAALILPIHFFQHNFLK